MKFLYFPYPAIARLISFDFVVFSVDRLPIYPCPVLTCFRMIPITVQYTIPCRFFPFPSIMVELAPPPYLLAVRHVLPTLPLITGTPPLFHSSYPLAADIQVLAAFPISLPPSPLPLLLLHDPQEFWNRCDHTFDLLILHAAVIFLIQDISVYTVIYDKL